MLRDHPLLRGVNDTSGVPRRRLTRKTPLMEVGRETSPTPKRRKWLLLLGPLRGDQESSHFPVSEGVWAVFLALRTSWIWGRTRT